MRLEQLCPFPVAEIGEALKKYPKARSREIFFGFLARYWHFIDFQPKFGVFDSFLEPRKEESVDFPKSYFRSNFLPLMSIFV